jgi:D-beta-D-heptose 7-phosphate kinase/D-beta-D-heptose 1-phosphate adenosyltransferase
MNKNDILKTIENVSVAVIGDLMLDAFVYGAVHRQSPEAPVPVLLTDHENIMPGGAGNAAANLGDLGVKTRLVGIVGDDKTARVLMAALRERGVGVEGIVSDASRPTIIKTRYVAQDGQLLRVDAEKTHALSDAIAAKVIDAARTAIDGAQAVILSDYAKGVLRADVIRAVIDYAAQKNIPVIVDPKGTDYSRYKGAFAITPNRKELGEITGLKVESDEQVVTAAQVLLKQAGVQNILAKRSEDGVSVIPAQGNPVHIKATAKDVRDVSGAGDTVVAVFTAAIAAGQSLENAARMANEAAGLVVAKPGTSTLSADEIEGRHSFIGPVMNEWGDAATRIKAWQTQGFKVGFTNGCFDILHYGHVNYLNQARGRCDKLVVGLNHDASVRILKGPTRPVNDQTARGTVMAALGSVDMVVFFGADEKGQDNTPCALIDAVRPDIFFKGGDYTIDQLPEAKIVQAYGGVVDIMPLYEGYSTTSTIEKMKNDKEKAA